MTRATLNILKSPEVIAINQDPLGVPGDLVWKQGPKEVRSLVFVPVQADACFGSPAHMSPEFPQEKSSYEWFVPEGCLFWRLADWCMSCAALNWQRGISRISNIYAKFTVA